MIQIVIYKTKQRNDFKIRLGLTLEASQTWYPSVYFCAVFQISQPLHAFVYFAPCPEKGCHQTHGGNFVKYQPIFKILLPLERERNFQ